jgi:hypothetical protein
MLSEVTSEYDQKSRNGGAADHDYSLDQCENIVPVGIKAVSLKGLVNGNCYKVCL